MDLDRTMECLGMIVGVGYGWNDEIVNNYVERMREWTLATEDVCEACAQLAEEWDRPIRIPLGKIKERAEDIAAERRKALRQADPGEIEGPRLSLEAAKAAAGRGYVSECERQGKKPDQAWLDHWFGDAPAPALFKRPPSVDEEF